MDPIIEEIPEICSAKIAQSTEILGCPDNAERGGYSVHPVPGPEPIIKETSRKTKDTGNSKNDRLFRRGNAMSVAPHINGKNQLPNPLMRIGITVKKIITTACEVTTVL